MTKYNPIDILVTLINTNFEVGRNNSSAPVKGGKRPHIIYDWDNNPDKPLPSLEFLWRARRDDIENLNASFRYTREEIRIIVRSAIQDECWKILTHVIDDILIPECKNFTTLSDYGSMEYNFIEPTTTYEINEYSEDVTYWRSDILVIMHKPKVYTLS